MENFHNKEIIYLRKSKGINHESIPLAFRAFRTSSSRLSLYFFPADEIYDPLGNSMEISRSPHLVKRFDTKDPNGSTVAPGHRVEADNSKLGAC